MIKLQGKYRLTFPVTPAEVEFKGYGNDTESVTSILLTTNNRISSRRPKSISFEFILPGNLETDYIEVDGYMGPREWLNGLDRLTGSVVLITIEELNLAWNVIVGPCDGKFYGKDASYKGTIEFPLFIKEEYVTWSNQQQLLSPAKVVSKPQKARANTSGKSAKKSSSNNSLTASAQQEIARQRDRLNRKLASVNKAERW